MYKCAKITKCKIKKKLYIYIFFNFTLRLILAYICILYIYDALLAGGVAGLYTFKSHLLHYVLFLSPSRDVLAEAQLEVKIGDIPEGKVLVVKWRGKPVFIYHR